MRIRTAIKTITFAVALSSVGACGGSYYNGYYDNYPYYYTGYGAYTVVHRPRVVVNRWTGRVWRYRPYRGYRVRVHHSPTDVYQATRGDETLEVHLSDAGSDSTRIEVKARKGEDGWDKASAKQLLSSIMSQDKDARNAAKKKNADNDK